MTDTVDLTLHPADGCDPTQKASLIGDLRPAFPGNDAVYGDGPGNGNPAITERIQDRLHDRFPAVAARVEFDPECSGFYCYGDPDDLAVVRTVIEVMAAEKAS